MLAEDIDGDVLRYTLEQAPNGMTMDADIGAIYWLPKSTDLGSHAVRVRLTDARGAYLVVDWDVVVSTTENQPPRITSTSITAAVVETAYSYQVQAVDPEGGNVGYELASAPNGMRIDAVTGQIDWIPSPSQAGLHSVSVRVLDPLGAYATQSWQISVTDQPNGTPEILSLPETLATVGTEYLYQVQAVDPDGDPLAYRLVYAPSGMTVDNLGTIRWIPSEGQKGHRPLEVRVEDDKGGFVTQAYAIDVVADGAPLEASLDIYPPTIPLGQTTAVHISTVGGVGNVTLQLSVNGSPLPIDESGTALVPGELVGSNTVELVATDDVQSITRASNFSVTGSVGQNPPIVQFHSPVDSVKISAPTPVVVSVDDDNLVAWSLYLRSADQQERKLVASGNAPVSQEPVYEFDPTMLLNGIYILDLEATDQDNQLSVESIAVLVEDGLKTGHFSITLEDLKIQMHGIDIELTRTYDTRQRNEQLDFGYGWNVNYQDIRVMESRTLGANWQQVVYPGPFFMDQYCTEPVGGRYPVVAVRLPDGELESFEMDVEPRCNVGYPVDAVTPVFKPRQGTHTQLASVDIVQLHYSNGALLDILNTLDPMDPSRYRLTTDEGMIYELDQKFGLRQITEPDGQTLTFTQDAITHSLGAKIDLVRDTQGRITDDMIPWVTR